MHENSTLPDGFLPNKIQQDDFILIRRNKNNQKSTLSSSATEQFAGVSPEERMQQKLIEERIRMQNVAENMEQALEYNPESFGSVFMLHIDVVINGFLVKAFVDTGAQTSIITRVAAEKTGLLRLLDRRFSGIAQGVGSAPIYGKIHLAEIQIGKSIFNSSFSVLEDIGGTPLILGLDLLRKYAATVDLKDNVLRIGNEIAPFLPDAEIYSEIVPVSLLTPQTGTASALQSLQQKDDDFMDLDDYSDVSEENIVRLESLGFDRSSVLKALRDSAGNIESAASRLIFGRSSVPATSKLNLKQSTL